MIRLIKNNNYIESYKQLKFVDKIKLSTSFFKHQKLENYLLKIMVTILLTLKKINRVYLVILR